VPEDAVLLPLQPEAELATQAWEHVEESLLGAGVTMQFALPQRMGARTRWFIAGVGIALLVVSAIVLFALNSLIGISTLMQNGPSSLLAALTIPLVPAFCINLLVNFIDRFEREPWFLRLAAFLWGALIAIPTAFLIEHNVDHIIQNVVRPVTMVGSMLQGLNAGITEETVKGLGLMLLFVVLRDEFDNVTDGIVYGALIGAGFAMVENFVYFAQNSKDFLLILIVGRVVLGWLSHSTFTVCFGAALGYIRHTRIRWRQIVIPLLGYLCAVGLHSVFDFIDYYANALILAFPGNGTVSTFALIAVVGDYIPPFITQIILLYFLIKSLAHEAAVIREFLAPEVSSGVVLVDEYALLQNSFQRTKTERRVLWRSGVKQWLRVKALYQTEIGLAFRKWHVSMGDKPKLGYVQPEDAYRQRIKRLRQDIVAADKAKK
jgi:RsiW-degrading membrane proteinase PrsW (M82 family)